MSSLERPPVELEDRAWDQGVHVGPPWCGTVYCPVCLNSTFADLGGEDRTVEEIAAEIRRLAAKGVENQDDAKAVLEHVSDIAELGLELADALGREGR